MPWLVECIEYKCLLCEDIWDKKYDHIWSDDESTATESKKTVAQIAKNWCKSCTAKIEAQDKQAKEERAKKQ